ncbi:hypothetical protein GGH94_000418 [Coemansia aciculifera]|uniref:Fibronectin type-III domain-containing protein n=2 Tax=Coemansia TaxID=4863 RepID=A0A9W8M938_9FUNG|nr:hypothetical protein GGH94_000418 [Coemansia aciculifera]
MKPGKQQQQPPVVAQPPPPPPEDYPVRVVLMSWDHILTFFVHHRACAALVLWLAVFLFDAIDTHMPAEWLVFTLFSFSVFVHAFAMSVLLFAALTAAMTMLNVAVFYLLPFKAASMCSTIVVCMLLVRAVHGLDAKGWAITVLMAVSRLSSPWCESLPNYLQAPIAAYCTSFAILWLAYHNARRIERLVDPISLLLGVVPPPRPPRIHLVAIHDKSVDVSWQPLPSPDTEEHDDIVLDARIRHYEVEVNGHIVGKYPSTVVESPINDLQPACMYQLRIWAVSVSRGRTPSLPVFVTTPTVNENLAKDGLTRVGDGSATIVEKDAAPAVDASKLRIEIEASQRTIQELESNIATIKSRADVERARLQEEISALRAQRKDEESSQAAQRENIRHLEAEKRHLESERVRLDKDIANALAKKQRAQDSMREQGRQADTYLRNAKSIEANMEKERRNHHHRQTELQTTIAALKAEVDEAKLNLASLSSQQAELANSLKTKRESLAAQEKRNAELDLKVKEALQKKRQMKESQTEIIKSTARMQAEIDVLAPQLEQVIRERRHLEMTAKAPMSATFPPPGFSTPSYPVPTAISRPSMYEIGDVATSSGDISAAELTLSSALSYPVSSIPAPTSQRATPDAGHKINNGNRHARSSSFATSPLCAPPAVYASTAYKPTSQRNMLSRGQASESFEPSPSPMHIGYPHGPTSATASRRSADFNDIFGYLDRDSSRLASATGGTSLTSAGLLSPLRTNSRDVASSSAAIDSISLRYAGNGSGNSTHSMPSTSVAVSGGTTNAASADFAPRLSSMAFWGEPIISPSSLSSTTAEASALSILKDTDLAYPTPERSSRRAVGQYGEPRSRRPDFRTPPPPAPTGLTHHSLSRMLSSSMEGLVDSQHHHGGVASASGEAPHSRFGSLDLRTGSAGSGGGWPEFDFSGSGDGWESGRSSTVNDRHTSPCADMAIADMNSFSLLRSATPVEPQPLRLSGDMLAVHRPHIEPIGAPIRRRPVGGGSPSPNDVYAPPLHPPVPPPAPIQFPPGFHMRREMSHPSSFGHSLYHKRSLWDHQEASAESSSPAPDQATSAAVALDSSRLNGNAPHGTG